MKRYNEKAGDSFPCYSCKHNTFEGLNCTDCINDKGTIFRKYEKDIDCELKQKDIK